MNCGEDVFNSDVIYDWYQYIQTSPKSHGYDYQIRTKAFAIRQSPVFDILNSLIILVLFVSWYGSQKKIQQQAWCNVFRVNSSMPNNSCSTMLLWCLLVQYIGHVAYWTLLESVCSANNTTQFGLFCPGFRCLVVNFKPLAEFLAF